MRKRSITTSTETIRVPGLGLGSSSSPKEGPVSHDPRAVSIETMFAVFEMARFRLGESGDAPHASRNGRAHAGLSRVGLFPPSTEVPAHRERPQHQRYLRENAEYLNGEGKMLCDWW
jgi:hypothetical protein